MSKRPKPVEPAKPGKDAERTALFRRPVPGEEYPPGMDPTATQIHRVEDLERTRQATQILPASPQGEGVVSAPGTGTERLDLADLELGKPPAPAPDSGLQALDPTSRMRVPLSELARLVQPGARPPAEPVGPPAHETPVAPQALPDATLRALPVIAAAPVESGPEPDTALLEERIQAPYDGTLRVLPEPAPAAQPPTADETCTAPLQKPPRPGGMPPVSGAGDATSPLHAPDTSDGQAATEPLQRPVRAEDRAPAADATMIVPQGLLATEAATGPVDRPARYSATAPEPEAGATMIVPRGSLPSEAGTAPVERLTPLSHTPPVAEPALDATVIMPRGGLLPEAPKPEEPAPVPEAPKDVEASAGATVVMPRGGLLPEAPQPEEPAPVPEASKDVEASAGATVIMPRAGLLPEAPKPEEPAPVPEAPKDLEAPAGATVIMPRAGFFADPAHPKVPAPAPDAPQNLEAPAGATVVMPRKDPGPPVPASQTLRVPGSGRPHPEPPSPLEGFRAQGPKLPAASTVAPLPVASGQPRPVPEPVPVPAAAPGLKRDREDAVPPSKGGGRALLWVALVGLLLVGAGGVYLLLRPSGTRTGGSKAQEAPKLGGFFGSRRLPEALRPYLKKAEAGDASAMRYLGACYINGLGVTADREEGLRWYRKAAAAGSIAAREELAQLEARK